MENKTKALAISAVVALAAVVGLTASGCRSDENSNSTADQSSTTNSQSVDQNDGKKINPFDGLEVSFGGAYFSYDDSVHGNVTFEANTDGCTAFVKEYVTFDCDTTNATNGSTVMVQAKCNSQDLKNNDITLTAVEQLYTVSAVKEIPSALSADVLDELNTKLFSYATNQHSTEFLTEGTEKNLHYVDKWFVHSVDEFEVMSCKLEVLQDKDTLKSCYKVVWRQAVTIELLEPSCVGDPCDIGETISVYYYVVASIDDFTVSDDNIIIVDEQTIMSSDTMLPWDKTDNKPVTDWYESLDRGVTVLAKTEY